MNERALITLGVVSFLAIACALLAIYAPHSRRILWIIGLAFALVVFGGCFVLCLIALFTHRHLNSRGVLMLFGNGYAVWMIWQYLRGKIQEPRTDVLPLELSTRRPQA